MTQVTETFAYGRRKPWRWSYPVNNMAVDDMATQGAKASAVTELSHFLLNLPVAALEWLNFYFLIFHV